MKTIVAIPLLALLVAALAAGIAFGPSAANAQNPTANYTVTHVSVNGARDSVQAVKDANKTATGVSSGHHAVVLDADATDAAILAAANALSTHTITTGSRYIDAAGEVHNFQSGKSSYWLIARQAPSPASTSPPGPVAGYTVTHVSVDGPRNSVQAVEDANKTASGVSGGHLEFTLAPGAANAEILAAADALSLHAITTGSRYIDAAGQVHNFQSGRSTYWLITKSEVNVAEPPALITAPLITPSYIGANTLALVGPIADQRLTKDVLYTSAVAFPAATGMDGTVIYSVADLPDGITLNAS